MSNESQILNILNQMQDQMIQTQDQMTQMQNQMIQTQDQMTQMQDQMIQMQDQMTQVQSDIKDLKEGQVRIENKLEGINEQTADLTEYRTDTTSKLDKLSDDLDYLTHKEAQTEKDVFTIKKKLNIVK